MLSSFVRLSTIGPWCSREPNDDLHSNVGNHTWKRYGYDSSIAIMFCEASQSKKIFLNHSVSVYLSRWANTIDLWLSINRALFFPRTLTRKLSCQVAPPEASSVTSDRKNSSLQLHQWYVRTIDHSDADSAMAVVLVEEWFHPSFVRVFSFGTEDSDRLDRLSSKRGSDFRSKNDYFGTR